MFSEGHPIVKGALSPPQRANMLDHERIFEDARAKEEQRVRRTENQGILEEKVAQKIVLWPLTLLTTAIVRINDGEYEPKGNKERKKISGWTGEWKDGSPRFELIFSTAKKPFVSRNEQPTLESVDGLRMQRGGTRVEIGLTNGEIIHITYEKDQNSEQDSIYPKPDPVSKWEDWIEEVVIREGLWGEMADKLSNHFILTRGIRLDISNPSLEVYLHYDRNRTSTTGSKIERSYRYNSDKDRFNEKGRDIFRTAEELEQEIRDLRDRPNADQIELDRYRELSSRLTIPLITPDDFTNGIQLLLATIPLE